VAVATSAPGISGPNTKPLKDQPARRAALRIAAHLGIWNVDEMLQTMPASLLSEWERFYQLEPFGAEADELRLGQISATLVNMYRSKNSKALTASDFLLTVHRPVREQTAEEQFAIFTGMFGNGTKH